LIRAATIAGPVMADFHHYGYAKLLSGHPLWPRRQTKK
jgi:hypothetical protein